MEYTKVESKRFQNVILRVTKGHFASPNAHVNYFLDTVPMKSRVSEARAVAAALAEIHYYTTPVDTIVCMDGMDVVGGYLAEELTKAGVISMNMHKSIYVLRPETGVGGQLIFRENLVPWIRGKNVLLLFDVAASGKTVGRALQVLSYYGATLSGVSAIFTTASKIAGLPVHALFTQQDLPDYEIHDMDNCPMCKQGEKLDALFSSMGVTKL